MRLAARPTRDLAVGWHYVEVRAIDSAGHVDISPALHNWTVQRPAETSVPDTTITMAPSDPTTSTSATFRLSADELGTTFECSLDGGAVRRRARRGRRTPSWRSATHTFEARATDAAGNVEPEPASHAWTIVDGDAAPPETFISSAPQTRQHEHQRQLRPRRDRVERDVRVLAEPRGVRRRARSPKTYLGLPGGDHMFLVRARDANGNVDPSPAIYEWTVEDVTPPDTQIVEAPANPSSTGTARFGFTGTDNTLVVEGEVVQLDVRVPPRRPGRRPAGADCETPAAATPA